MRKRKRKGVERWNRESGNLGSLFLSKGEVPRSGGVVMMGTGLSTRSAFSFSSHARGRVVENKMGVGVGVEKGRRGLDGLELWVGWRDGRGVCEGECGK